jgi:hypothetical protein
MPLSGHANVTLSRPTSPRSIMTLFDNPIRLAQEVRELRRAVAMWQHRLHQGDIDASGPFIGKPELTVRAAFSAIADQNEPAAVKQAWNRWVFFLTDYRVNAPLLAAMAQAYRVERHKLERPEPIQLSLEEMLRRTLTLPGEREIWSAFLADHGWTLQSLVIELVVRQNELARRAGFSSCRELTAPTVDLKPHLDRMLAETADLCRAMVPTKLGSLLDAALATNATLGWPAQLQPRTVQSLLGTNREWFKGLDLAARRLPAPIAASSFVRALWILGDAVAEAAAPKNEPFVIAHDPYGLARHTAGALFARLTTSARWQRDILSLSPAKAREQARMLLVSQLIHARTMALCVCVRDSAVGGLTAALAGFEEQCHRTLGFVLPRGLAAILPRLRVDIEQRLVGQWLAAQLTRRLVAEFDEDWFRNPRGIEAVRDHLSRVHPISVSKEEASGGLDAFVAGFAGAL